MLDKVREIIVEQLGVEADQVKPESNFVDDLGADSLDTVEQIRNNYVPLGIKITGYIYLYPVFFT